MRGTAGNKPQVGGEQLMRSDTPSDRDHVGGLLGSLAGIEVSLAGVAGGCSAKVRAVPAMQR